MASVVAPLNTLMRIRAGNKIWNFVGLSYSVSTDAYLTGGENFAVGATMPTIRVDKLRQLTGLGQVEAIFSMGIDSDHQANSHILINTGGYDLRFEYATQLYKLYKIGRSNAPATVASEVELDNDSSINAAGAVRRMLVIGSGAGNSSDSVGSS